ncbi:MAG: acetyl-CoA carboxylase, carboxyltransferase component, subunit alpha and beta [Proteobacteria bacterium]|nr:acetyl-CoA carboxylase, carboxyltransferase component, subunit alpha and beta [Pseudomonadota bacterium]
MTALKSGIDTHSGEYLANAQALRAAVADLRNKVEQAASGGSEEARAKHLARGKLLVRDRIDALLDPGTPFLELSQAAAPTKCRLPASSPASAGSADRSASSSPTTPR